MFSYLKNTFFGTNKLTPWVLNFIVGRPVESRSRLMQVVSRGGGWWSHSSSEDHDDDTAFVELHDGTHSVRAYLSKACKEKLRRDHGDYFLQFTERGSIVTIGEQLTRVKCPYTKFALQIEVLTPKKAETGLTARFRPVSETIEVRQIIQAQRGPWRTAADIPLGDPQQLLSSPEAVDQLLGRNEGLTGGNHQSVNAPIGNVADLFDNPEARAIALQLALGQEPTESLTNRTGEPESSRVPIGTVEDLFNNKQARAIAMALVRGDVEPSAPTTTVGESTVQSGGNTKAKQATRQANKTKESYSGWSSDDAHDDGDDNDGNLADDVGRGPPLGIRSVLQQSESPASTSKSSNALRKSRISKPRSKRKLILSAPKMFMISASRKNLRKVAAKSTKRKSSVAIEFVATGNITGPTFEVRYTNPISRRWIENANRYSASNQADGEE